MTTTPKTCWLLNDLRDGETVELRGKSYPTVGAKLRILRENFPTASLTPEAIRLDADSCIFRATVQDGARSASAYGTANATSDARLKDNLVELAETRAIARALRFFGIGVDATSLEEVAGKPPLEDRDHHAPSPARRANESSKLVTVHFQPANPLTLAQRARLETRGYHEHNGTWRHKLPPAAATREKGALDELELGTTTLEGGDAS